MKAEPRAGGEVIAKTISLPATGRATDEPTDQASHNRRVLYHWLVYQSCLTLGRPTYCLSKFIYLPLHVAEKFYGRFDELAKHLRF